MSIELFTQEMVWNRYSINLHQENPLWSWEEAFTKHIISGREISSQSTSPTAMIQSLECLHEGGIINL